MRKILTTVVVCRGNPGQDGNLTRVQLLNIVMRLFAKAYPRSELLSDDATIVLNVPIGDEGDYKWCLDNVMNRAYLDSVYSDEEAQEKADRLFAAYEACPDRDGKLGVGLIRYYLEMTYLREEGLASVYVR